MSIESHSKEYRADLINIVLNCLTVVISAGSVFLTSARFGNEQNGIKWFVWGTGSIAWLLLVLLGVRDLKVLASALFSRKMLKCLFVLGTVQAMFVLVQFFGLLPSNHDLLKATGTFENPAGVVSVIFP